MSWFARRGLKRGLLAALLITIAWLGWAIAYLLDSSHQLKHRHTQPSSCECIQNT
jgi:hypothetical protein